MESLYGQRGLKQDPMPIWETTPRSGHICFVRENGYTLNTFGIWKPVDLEQLIAWIRFCGYEDDYRLDGLDVQVLS